MATGEDNGRNKIGTLNKEMRDEIVVAVQSWLSIYHIYYIYYIYVYMYTLYI